jgi:hypothetical protein
MEIKKFKVSQGTINSTKLINQIKKQLGYDKRTKK